MLLLERLGAPEPVNRGGGPDCAEKEGAHEDDRQHNELERFHRVFQDEGRS
jgi:hypothetical protein